MKWQPFPGCHYLLTLYTMKKIFGILLALIATSTGIVRAQELNIKIKSNYLNLPVSASSERKAMSLVSKGMEPYSFNIRLAPAEADYWVFCDVSGYKGKILKISYTGNPAGLKNIYQSDKIAGQDSLYRESFRPQQHFTFRRGWNNDPNGLSWFDGEYHLFGQHNPFEADWENMHWGHAVSTDLIHWTELPEALRPDETGSMFSGTVVVDYDNDAGFNKDGKVAMIAFYTADSPTKQVQCIAYSLDRGRSWTKYAGNPVIDSCAEWSSKDTRDPKVFKYKDRWVLALSERDGISIYNSKDLKNWTRTSHITGFWECPDLFELPVGNTTKWVLFGASGAYLIGDFDGATFTPEEGKHLCVTGTVYASQTFNCLPDGRRILVGWEPIQHQGMPFKGQMSLPMELSLKQTSRGIRMYANPVKETESLQTKLFEADNLSASQAEDALNKFGQDSGLRIKGTMHMIYSTAAGLSLNGQNIVDYNMSAPVLNGVYYSPDSMTGMDLDFDLIIDKTSVEAFFDGGALVNVMGRNVQSLSKDTFRFFGTGLQIPHLEIYTLDSIWDQ